MPDLVGPHLRPGALVVADNANFFPPYVERARAPDSGYLSIRFGENVELSIGLG